MVLVVVSWLWWRFCGCDDSLMGVLMVVVMAVLRGVLMVVVMVGLRGVLMVVVMVGLRGV